MFLILSPFLLRSIHYPELWVYHFPDLYSYHICRLSLHNSFIEIYVLCSFILHKFSATFPPLQLHAGEMGPNWCGCTERVHSRPKVLASVSSTAICKEESVNGIISQYSSRSEILILPFTISREVYSLLWRYSATYSYDIFEIDSLIRNIIPRGNVSWYHFQTLWQNLKVIWIWDFSLQEKLF